MVETNPYTGMFESNLKRQEGGNHYKDNGIQPIEFIYVNDLPFIEGCIVKYITRAEKKGGKEDVFKVIHYAQMLLELRYGVKSEIKYE